ncbi:hypothetical protein BH10BAC4_BH10BAC4_16030 [soil metagenome]
MAELPEFKPRKIKFKAWDTESRLLMKLNNIDCNKGELLKKDHILLQFTGMCDKNGDEIYEMDVLLISDQKFVVFWKDEKGGWYYYSLKNPADHQIFLGPEVERMIRLGSLFELNTPYLPPKKK